MMQYDKMALDLLLNTKISAKGRQQQLSKLAKEVSAKEEGRVECPECGHKGPHDSNGLPHQHDEHTLCCCECGMQFCPNL
jgi:transcription elongation factor Elf1